MKLNKLFSIPLVLLKFDEKVTAAVEIISTNSNKDVDENGFIDASRLVYDGVREIRRAVLMNRVGIFIYRLKLSCFVFYIYMSDCA